MELPKNITQIGESDRYCKIYVEDYVVSYIKQVNQLALNKEMAVALYGVRKTEGNVMYLFIYGACKLDFLQRETRHLSQAQCQEIEKLRKKYFPDYEFQGYRLLNGEMVEGFHVCEQEICRYITGYAQFYEKNDSMLAYMLDMRPEEATPEYVDQEKYEMVKRRQEERRAQNGDYRDSGFHSAGSAEKREEEETGQSETGMAHEGSVRENGRGVGNRMGRAGRDARTVKTERNARASNAERESKDGVSAGGMYRMRFATVAVFAVLCVLGVGTLGQDKSLEEWKDLAKQAMSSLTEQKLPDAQAAGSQDVVLQNPNIVNEQNSTLIAEDKLAEALQAENVATGSSSNGLQEPPQAVGNQVIPGTVENQYAGNNQTAQGTVDAQQSNSQPTQIADSTQPSNTVQPSIQPEVSQETVPQESVLQEMVPQEPVPQEPTRTDTSNTVDTQETSGEQSQDVAAETVSQPTSYTIKQGDTLIGISIRNYGTDIRVAEICSLNQISNPDDIKVGQKILLP